MRTSAKQVPSVHRVIPRYLKPVTSSNFWPFILISALILFMLLVTISKQDQRRTEVTRNLHHLNLLAKPMVLLHQILFSLAIAANVEAILMQIAAKQVPSLQRAASR